MQCRLSELHRASTDKKLPGAQFGQLFLRQALESYPAQADIYFHFILVLRVELLENRINYKVDVLQAVAGLCQEYTYFAQREKPDVGDIQ